MLVDGFQFPPAKAAEYYAESSYKNPIKELFCRATNLRDYLKEKFYGPRDVEEQGYKEECYDEIAGLILTIEILNGQYNMPLDADDTKTLDKLKKSKNIGEAFKRKGEYPTSMPDKAKAAPTPTLDEAAAAPGATASKKPNHHAWGKK